MKRKRYSPAEKAKIALEAIKGELTMAQITSKYSVHATQINSWKNKALAYLPDAFSNKDKKSKLNYEQQLEALYGHIGRLKVENEYLKKKFEVLHG